jgi:hypothetical protein
MGLMSASLILRCSQATFTLPAPCCLSLWFATRHAPRRGERGFYIHGYNRFHTAWPFHRHPCGWSCNHWRPDSTSNATQPVEPALSTWATLDMKATTAPVASAIDPGVQMSLRTTLTHNNHSVINYFQRSRGRTAGIISVIVAILIILSVALSITLTENARSSKER